MGSYRWRLGTYYEHLRMIHCLFVIPYAFGLFHAYFSSRYDLFQPTLLGIFTAITLVVGLASTVYMYVLYQRTQFKHQNTAADLTFEAFKYR